MINEMPPGVTQLDGPIPGQSLTDEPGKMPWESPPEYTNVEKALDYVLTNITRDEQLRELLVMMDSKMPLESITRTILFTGFSKGKWSYDMMVLMGKPLLQMLVAIGKAADIDFELAMPYHKKKDNWVDIISKVKPMSSKDVKPDVPVLAEMNLPPKGGLMSRPGV